jgi:hypothetical protein
MPKILIKYEDLEKNTYKNFKSILEFVNNFIRKKIEIDEKKILKTVEDCSFNNLSKLEKKSWFFRKRQKYKLF